MPKTRLNASESCANVHALCLGGAWLKLKSKEVLRRWIGRWWGGSEGCGVGGGASLVCRRWGGGVGGSVGTSVGMGVPVVDRWCVGDVGCGVDWSGVESMCAGGVWSVSVAAAVLNRRRSAVEIGFCTRIFRSLRFSVARSGVCRP